MTKHHIDKRVKDFLSKNLSFSDNIVYTITSIASILVKAATNRTYLEEEADKPNADTIFYRIKATINSIVESFWNSTEQLLVKNAKILQRQQLFIAVDETYEPYFGKKKNIWIHNYKPVKGATGSFKFIVFSIVGFNYRFVLYAEPVHIGMNNNKLIAKVLNKIRMYIKIKAVLLDRGFNDRKLIAILNKLKIKYLMLWRVKKWVKEELKCMREGELKEIIKELLYSENKSKHKVKVKFVLIKRKSKEDYDWCFATNLNVRKACFLIKIYKKRWNIENIFKITDKVRLRTNSTNVEIKFLFFSLSLLIYNLWQWLRGSIGGITLRKFAKFILTLIEKKVEEKRFLPQLVGCDDVNLPFVS